VKKRRLMTGNLRGIKAAAVAMICLFRKENGGNFT
jgi:hypothetical protein